jgi:pyruvate/2-oxoglutarate dehydrogenase complex dihydrolipoamide acyltransferase (E2) component
MVTLGCCGDHRVWDGRMGEIFLTGLKAILEEARFNVGAVSSET